MVYRKFFVEIGYTLVMTPSFTIPLWSETAPYLKEGTDAPTLTAYLAPNNAPRGAVLVLPGGGYQMRADHEGAPVALWLNSLGIHAFVVAYRVAPYRHPVPLIDAQRAIRSVRYNAAEWGIDGEKIGVLGFSAGGHLAATLGTWGDVRELPNSDSIDEISSRPDALVLCYPVISFGEFGHFGLILNLLGESPDPELQQSLSIERQVSHDTPPTFLWHTADDAAVPVENSLLFASSLSRSEVPLELHVYPHGNHGLGLAEGDPVVSQWTTACGLWLRGRGF